jgi:hypothetical protein
LPGRSHTLFPRQISLLLVLEECKVSYPAGHRLRPREPTYLTASSSPGSPVAVVEMALELELEDEDGMSRDSRDGKTRGITWR